MKRPGLESHSAHAATFQDLPETVLHQILRLLPARELAVVSVQDKYLQYVTADSALWEPLALARWPGADADQQYGGDWQKLYLSRAPLPHNFPLAADKIRAVTAAQQRRQEQQQGRGMAAVLLAAGSGDGGSSSSGCSGSSSSGGALPQLAFEEVMRQIYAAGLACGTDRSVRRTAEWRVMKQDVTWWATQRPEVVVAFVRSTHETLVGGGRGAARSDTPWRRSAVAFLQELSLLTGAHASVINRVANEAAALDRSIRSIQAGASAAAPEGTPAAHWWFG